MLGREVLREPVSATVNKPAAHPKGHSINRGCEQVHDEDGVDYPFSIKGEVADTSVDHPGQCSADDSSGATGRRTFRIGDDKDGYKNHRAGK